MNNTIWIWQGLTGLLTDSVRTEVPQDPSQYRRYQYMPDGVKIRSVQYRDYEILWNPNGPLPPLEYCHRDYDGPPDKRAGRQHNLADCIADIDELDDEC